jgi:hypothetical protein
VDEEVGDEVLLLHGQEQDIRNRFGHLVDKEKHDGEELTIYGGWRLRDPQSTVKETADDVDSWGKMTSQQRRLAMRKESRNGTAKWQLAGGKCAAVTYLSMGKSYKKGEELQSPAPFIGGGE